MNVLATRRLKMLISDSGVEATRQQVEWLNDPEVVAYSEQRHRKHTSGSQFLYFHSFQPPHLFREIYYNSQLIGTISARIDAPNNIAEVGLMIGDKTKWGMGFGGEAWKEFCDYLFATRVRKIEAGCMEGNISMIKICERYGMRLEATIMDHFLWKKKPMAMLRFGKLEWETGGQDGKAS